MPERCHEEAVHKISMIRLDDEERRPEQEPGRGARRESLLRNISFNRLGSRGSNLPKNFPIGSSLCPWQDAQQEIFSEPIASLQGGLSQQNDLEFYSVCLDDKRTFSGMRRDHEIRSPARFVHQMRNFSASLSSAMEFTRSRAVSLTQLQNGAKQYYKENSRTFGQVVPVDEEIDLPQHQDQNLIINVGLESSGEKITQTKASEVQTRSRLQLIILEQSWFTVYKRLFVISFLLNLMCLILAVTHNFPYAKSRASLFSVANILIVVLVRNEVFLRILFWLAVHLLGYKWIPLRIKTMTTSFLQSVGGIHSGCGMAAIMWLLYAITATLKNPNESSVGVVGLAWAILILLILSSFVAFPLFRHVHHNIFETVHRFAGWATLVAVWAFVILSNHWDSVTQSYRVTSSTLLQMQSLWYTAATTFMIFLPWVFVRKVAVQTVVSHTKLNSLLHFEGGVKPGILARISPSPFSEWHAFGIISNGEDKHTILAGAVGDFTKGLVENPPTHLWVRSFHFAGLPYLTNMYNKAILVATGSGICVFMSFLLQRTRAEVHVIWIAKNIQASYGDGIWQVVKQTPSDRFTVIDTATSGRPKTKELVVKKAKEWQAEVVIVTSNPSGTNEIVSGCNAAGIPAFGPIWDS